MGSSSRESEGQTPNNYVAISRIRLREERGNANAGEVAVPPGGEGDFAHGGAFHGVDHGGGRGEDGGVLGDGGAAPAEDEDRAGLGRAGGDLEEVAAGGVEQGLLAGGFRPVAGVGGERLRLAAVELAIDAADEADAVGAGALGAGLVVVGRAEPGAGEEDDVGAGHG